MPIVSPLLNQYELVNDAQCKRLLSHIYDKCNVILLNPACYY